MNIKLFVLLMLLNTSFTSSLFSQEDRFSDFNFWIGSWDVYIYGSETLAGKSEIKSILGGKVIEENYMSSSGNYRGTSNNLYNAQELRWEQYWVDNTGLALHIKGSLVDGKMVMSDCKNDDCNKIIWTPLPEGRVRQEWMQSKDKGKSWTKAFDGLYISNEKKSTISEELSELKEFPSIRDFTLAKLKNEAYITVQDISEDRRVICRINKAGDKWSEPEPVHFSGKFKDLEPSLSPDNLTLYFVSDRPNKFASQNYDIWYVERDSIEGQWSLPINAGENVNTESDEFYPSVSNSGNLYFTSVRKNGIGKDDIYLSKRENNSFQVAMPLSDRINTPSYEFNCFVAPDESFIIFSGYNRIDGLGSGDMYICYKDKDQNWSEAKNLRDINSKQMDYCPFVDLNTNTIFFTSKRSTINSSIEIDNNFDLSKEVKRYQNGSSRIYSSPFNIIKIKSSN
jgi:hypothetical protein